MVITTNTYAVRVEEDRWTYIETVSLAETPIDTLSEKYVYVKEDWDRSDNAATTPYRLFEKYTRNIKEVDMDNNVMIDENGIQTPIATFETKTIEIYEPKDIMVDYSRVRVPVNANNLD